MTTTGDEYIFDNLCFNGLTRMREDLVVEPDLAESWTYSDDLKHWTFKLKRGVKFHDGSVMEAADVAAMFTRMLNPATASPARSQNDMIESVVATDASTVMFDLKVPYGGLADILTDRQVKITPRAAVEQMKTKPIGTGPFKFVSYTPGDRVVLARNQIISRPVYRTSPAWSCASSRRSACASLRSRRVISISCGICRLTRSRTWAGNRACGPRAFLPRHGTARF
jgi:ABC-type transport system substrate-binding protein